MPESVYKTIFHNSDNRTHLVPKAFTNINDWYSNKIVERSVHDPASPIGVTVLDNVKRIPLLYMYKTEDYGAIRNSKDVATCIDYFHPESNIAPPVKNWCHWHTNKKNDLGLFSKIHCVSFRVKN